MSELVCHNCVGACCQGNTILELSAEERDHMLAGGAEFQKIVDPVPYDREYVVYPNGVTFDEAGKPKFVYLEGGRKSVPLAAGLGRYFMMAACGYLTTDENGVSCAAYDRRPRACQDFEVGSAKCQFLRQLHGVDPWPEDMPDLPDLLGMLRSE